MSDLHVDSIIKSFDTKQLLTDVFISCKKGEIIGLLGRNGSGKSTLLKIIFGSVAAEGRFVKVGNQLSTGVYDNRNLIKYLPQDSFLPNHIKLKILVGLFCEAQQADKVKQHELIQPLLNKKSEDLSGGEKRLLETLLILYSHCPYILMDEPFNGVAPILKDTIKELIQEQAVDKGIIITDHDYRNILDIATRIILLDNGVVKEIEGKDDLVRYGYLPKNHQ